MLRRIQIRDLAIIDNLELDLAKGMTIITGETGAGKSIIIDALEIALGERADSKLVRHGAPRCEIILEFDLSHIPAAKNWLQAGDFDDIETCLIRRVIQAQDGRSRNYINGSLVTVQQLKELSYHLIHIHGQHQHQALVKREEQRELLDLYAEHPDLLQKVETYYQQWREIKKAIENIEALEQQNAEISLLRYQVEELEQLAVEQEELAYLDQEQKKLAHADELLQQTQMTLALIADDSEVNISQLMQQTLSLLNHMRTLSPALGNATELMNNALIQLNEAENEIRAFFDKLEIDPEKLQTVELRLQQIYQLARKHKIPAEELANYFIDLQQRLALLENSQHQLATLNEQEKILRQQYIAAAEKLHHSRQKAAKKLNQAVTDNMQLLGMNGGVFAIDIQLAMQAQPSAHGLDKIEFLVSANRGQPLQSMAKVASGGELSRIGLAIQVITAQAVATPSLIFDEVDVGIGGGTAEIVGKLLRQLGEHAQVLCITHLPQVAAQGHQHLRIHKQTVNEHTFSQVTLLDEGLRTEEIARMLGGVKITAQSMAHAKEMLTEAASA